MRSRFFLLTSIALVMAVSGVRSQDTLKIQDALIIAMENNFDIYLAMNDNRLADLSNNPGNAGMLPDLSVTGSRSISVNNTEQRYFDGRERTSPNAKNNTISAGVALGWTLFDGFNMFIQKRKLEELENLSEIQLRAVVENT
ncbi:MAG: TolC family protein, partial [Bacteroidales bacterium]